MYTNHSGGNLEQYNTIKFDVVGEGQSISWHELERLKRWEKLHPHKSQPVWFSNLNFRSSQLNGGTGHPYPTFILVPRARRFLVTWSGNVGYKLSRVALGTRMPYLLIDKSPEMKTLHYRLAFQENITPSLSFCPFFISEKPGSISCFNWG